MREIYTEEVLIEFHGDFQEVFFDLIRLLGTELKTYPADDDSWWGSQEVIDEYERLVDLLDKKAPPGYYFGANQHHPQCLGYWRTPWNTKK